MKTEAILDLISNSENFAEVRNSGILPEPDADDGYYFISYSHTDYKKVLPDVISLRENGVKIWYNRGLESGKSWINEVKKKISSYYCKGVIFYLSENYFSSQSCLTEIIYIMQQNKPCIFIPLEAALPPETEENITEFLSIYPQIEYEAAAEQKARLLALLPKPPLFEFYATEKSKLFHIFPIKRLAVVTKLADRNLQRVEIPPFAYIDGKKLPIRGIACNAFENCELLEEVTVPDNWSVIMENAFVNCPSLKKINLGKPRILFFRGGGIKRAFSRCENLREISCPKGRLLLSDTLCHNERITDINLPENFIAAGACFASCNALETATLHSSDLLTNGGMFANCIALREVNIPDKNVSRIVGEKSFFNCKSLSKIRLPKAVRSIRNSAFCCCAALPEINIPEKTLFIAPSAFDGCESLKTVTCDTKNYKFLSSGSEIYFMDGLFPCADTFYLKAAPKTRIFSRRFMRTESDRRGYILFKKVESNL